MTDLKSVMVADYSLSFGSNNFTIRRLIVMGSLNQNYKKIFNKYTAVIFSL